MIAHHSHGNVFMLAVLLATLLPVLGCPPNAPMDGTDGGTGEDNGGGATGEFDPEAGLMLETGGVRLTMPAGALIIVPRNHP